MAAATCPNKVERNLIFISFGSEVVHLEIYKYNMTKQEKYRRIKGGLVDLCLLSESFIYCDLKTDMFDRCESIFVR